MTELFRFNKKMACILALAVAGCGLLYFFRLHRLLPGYSLEELAANRATLGIHVIWNNPDYAPYKLLLYFIHKLGGHSLLWARGLSGLVAISFVGLFYYVAYKWYSPRVAFLGTLLFALSSGVLHATHTATPIGLQLGLLALFAGIIFYQTERKALSGGLKAITRYGLALLLLALIYTPGMIWFVLLGTAFFIPQIWELMQEQPKKRLAILILLGLLGLAPLIWISAHNLKFLQLWLGFPDYLPSLTQLGQNAKELLSQLVFRSHYHPELSVIGGSVLGVIDVGLIFLGVAVQFRRPIQRTNWVLLACLLGAFILASLGGAVTYVMLVPLLYLLIASGLFYLLQQWNEVFPRNPIAQLVSTSLILLLVGFAVLYHVRAYYAAWPHVPATRQAFSQAAPAE